MNRFTAFIIPIVLFLILFACSEKRIKKNDIEPIIGSCTIQPYPPVSIIIESHSDWTKTHYPNRIEEFKQDSIFSNNIVMIGNSLTEQGGNWSTRLDIEGVINRGISGDNTQGVLARLGEIICAKPKSVFIMIGTNDLWTDFSVEEVGESIDLIASTLFEALAESEIYVQTIMPLEKEHEMTNRLASINQEIRSFQNKGYKVLDTFEAMANSEGYLESNLTNDGVHLTEAGYRKWADFLKMYLE